MILWSKITNMKNAEIYTPQIEGYTHTCYN